MASNLGVHRHADPNMEIPFRPQMPDSMGCAGRGGLRPMRVSQGARAHRREVVGTKIQLHKEGRPSLLRQQNTLPRGFAYHTDGAIPGDRKWAVFSSSPDSALTNQLLPELVCDAEFSTTKMDNSLPGSVVSINTGSAANFEQSTSMSDGAYSTLPRKPSTPLGWLSLGSCGNALIMRVGSDARCFHHQRFYCGLIDGGEHTSCGNTSYAPSDVKVVSWSCSSLGGTISEVNAQKGVSLFQGKSSTTKREGSSRGRQNKQRKVGKTTALTRNLYERSSFHLLEVLFCFPFSNANAVALSSRILSQKSLKELVTILNQTAVGLAGVSATWVLFLGSRILWLNVPLNKHTMASLAIGFGFLSLSWAMKRVSEVLMCLAEIYGKSRRFQHDFITGLQKELQCIALNACLLLVMCFMGAG